MQTFFNNFFTSGRAVYSLISTFAKDENGPATNNHPIQPTDISPQKKLSDLVNTSYEFSQTIYKRDLAI